MNEDEPARWAQFRFSVIAPLVCRTLDEEQRKSLKQEILNHSCITPDGHEKYIPRRTLNEWLAKYKKNGFSGLFRSGRNRNNVCNAIDAELLDKAEELRRQDRARSIRVILSLLQAEGFDVSKVSKTTLNWQLNKRGVSRITTAPVRGTFQRWEQKHANALWQADTSAGIWLPDPINPKQVKRTRLISFIDDASRICTHAEFYFNEQLPNLVDCFRKALLKRGKPQRLLCDNAFIYHSNTMTQMCAHLGIEPSFCRPYAATSKGKVERKYGTFKSFFYREAGHAGLTTLEELNKFFWAWLTKEYHHVKHGSLGMTPDERWRQDVQLIRRVAPEDIRQALMLTDKRTVNARTAIIRLDNKEYQAGIDLAGTEVEVRWDVGNDQQIEVWQNGKLIQTASLFKIGTNIDFSRKPQRIDEPPGLTYASSKRYRQSLVAQYEGEKPVTDDYLSFPEFSALVAKLLEPERVLESEEITSLEKFFFEHSPLPARKTETLLVQAVSAKGTKLHVRFYLQHILSSIPRR